MIEEENNHIKLKKWLERGEKCKCGYVYKDPFDRMRQFSPPGENKEEIYFCKPCVHGHFSNLANGHYDGEQNKGG